MTNIDTYVAQEFWSKNGKTEIDFLKQIEFVAYNDEGQITFITDEEANGEIILTPKSALYVAEQLVRMVKEKGIKITQKQLKNWVL